ncbi:MAG: zinc ribbon domain-containing protein [Ruminococcus sp.]|nr:zinc ribbon domain-containing protein [Ruminococcus sp.]
MNNYQTTFNPFSQNISIVKSYFRKKTVLTQGILYIVAALLNIATVLMMMPVMNNFMSTVFSIPELTADMTAQEFEFISSFMDIYINSVMIVSLVMSVALSALVATAYFLMYFKSKSDNPMSTPNAGVTILYVLSIIQLIPIIITTVMMALMIILMFVMALIPELSSDYNSGGSVAIIAIIYTIVFGGMCTLLLLYFINQVRYYKSIRTSLNTVTLTNKGAGIFGVLSMIYGIYTALNALSSFGVIPMFNMISTMVPEFAVIEGLLNSFVPVVIISAVTSAVLATIYIINAVIALGYKNHIKNHTNNYNEFSASIMQPQIDYNTPQQTSQEMLLSQPEPDFQPDVFYDNSNSPASAVCPRCGTVAKESDIFCNECGAKIK